MSLSDTLGFSLLTFVCIDFLSSEFLIITFCEDRAGETKTLVSGSSENGAPGLSGAPLCRLLVPGSLEGRGGVFYLRCLACGASGTFALGSR